jgi:hypothetical protein
MTVMVYCAAVDDLLDATLHVYLHRSPHDQNMETIQIPIPANHSSTTLLALIERSVSDAGLLAARLELRSYPGATHWHIRRPGAKGTLELTYWPQAYRLWFAVHANRSAEWIAPAINDLMARMMQVGSENAD